MESRDVVGFNKEIGLLLESKIKVQLKHKDNFFVVGTLKGFSKSDNIFLKDAKDTVGNVYDKLVIHGSDWVMISLEETPFVSQANGAPGPGESPVLFALPPSGSSLNPALDSLLPLLAPGARLTIAVPPGWGSGQSGFYPAEVPGQRRFIISPGALLIYEIEALEPSGS